MKIQSVTHAMLLNYGNLEKWSAGKKKRNASSGFSLFIFLINKTILLNADETDFKTHSGGEMVHGPEPQPAASLEWSIWEPLQEGSI